MPDETVAPRGRFTTTAKTNAMSGKAVSKASGSPNREVSKTHSNATETRREQIVTAAVRLFSESGYFRTTIDDIAKEADVSKGLVYLYFKDKNDLLFYALRFVLDMYESDVASLLERYEDPLARLRMSLRMFCRLVDGHRQEFLLAYRSTKDLTRAERALLKQQESRIWRVIRTCLEACIHKGLMKPVNIDIMVFQYVMFSHTWALKNWAFRDKYSFEEYLRDGEKILIDNFLTDYGREVSATWSEEDLVSSA